MQTPHTIIVLALVRQSFGFDFSICALLDYSSLGQGLQTELRAWLPRIGHRKWQRLQRSMMLTMPNHSLPMLCANLQADRPPRLF